MVQELSTVKYFTGLEAPPEPQRTVSSQWTKGIWITCIICCIAGCYGLVHGTQMVQEIVAEKKQDFKKETYNAEAYRYQKEVERFKKKNQSILIFHRVIEFCVGGALLVGGALMMWRSPLARKVVFAACLAAVLFHVSTAMLKLYQFISLREFFDSTAQTALRKSGIGGEHRDRVLQQGLGSLGFGHALGVLVSLALQCAVYLRMMFFVSQPHVREIFAEDPYPDMTEIEAEMLASDAVAFAATVRQAANPGAASSQPTKTDAPNADKFARI